MHNKVLNSSDHPQYIFKGSMELEFKEGRGLKEICCYKFDVPGEGVVHMARFDHHFTTGLSDR